MIETHSKSRNHIAQHRTTSHNNESIVNKLSERTSDQRWLMNDASIIDRMASSNIVEQLQATVKNEFERTLCSHIIFQNQPRVNSKWGM